MRILVLNYEYPPLGGGAGVATAALAQELVKRGLAVDVVTSSPTAEARVEQFSAPRGSGILRVFRVRSRRIGIHEAGMMGAASYLVNALPLVRQLLQAHRYDLVHVFFSLPTGALLPFIVLGGIPLIVSLRGSDVPGYDPFNISMQRFHRLLAPLTRWIWRRADRVVPVCESLGRQALMTCPELAYSVVPNGVDLDLFRPRDPARPIDGEPIRCLAVARLVERKGLGELIRAFASLPRGKYELEIVGDGPDEHVLRELAGRLGVAREILFRGALDRESVARRYRAAHLFTLPSSAEAFGNVFAEALASGLPVIGSDVGGIPELIEHGVNGFLVTPGNPQTLAHAIQYLADDPELRMAMSLRNRAKAEATLNWAQVTGRYVSIYEGVMKQLPAPSLVPQPIASPV
jgi:glycosyltransferase involved in cell wall biosynthesis